MSQIERRVNAGEQLRLHQRRSDPARPAEMRIATLPGQRCVDHTSHHSPAESGNSRESAPCSDATPVLLKHNTHDAARWCPYRNDAPYRRFAAALQFFSSAIKHFARRGDLSACCVFSGSELTRIKQAGLVCVRIVPQFGIRREMNMLITSGKASVTGPCQQELVRI